MLFLRPGRKHSKRVMLGTKASSAESSVEKNISSARRHVVIVDGLRVLREWDGHVRS
jgi:hypothetical protein